MRQQIFYRMKLREQRDPCLFTDTGIPGILSELSPINPLEVDELRRCQSIMLDHFYRNQIIQIQRCLFRDEDLRLIGRELQRVLVSGDDERLDVHLLRKTRGCADDVVCLKAFQPSVRIRMACSTSLSSGICMTSSGGIGLRPALYASYSRWRKVGAFKSNATVRYIGS